MNDEYQEWFRVPVSVWDTQKNVVWTKKNPAPEAWAIIDASWLSHHKMLLSKKYTRERTRELARRWGWTISRTDNFLCDFTYAEHVRNERENPSQRYRPIRRMCA